MKRMGVFFLKVNIVSMLYALMIAIPIQFMLNVCRISRLTEWTIDTVDIVSSVIIISGFILCSVFLINLTKRWLSETKARYCNVILWLPYFVLSFSNYLPGGCSEHCFWPYGNWSFSCFSVLHFVDQSG